MGIVLQKTTKIFRKKYFGYEDSKLVDLVIQKNIHFRRYINKSIDSSAFRIISAVELLGDQKSINVLDFGGGAGHHHAIAQYLFPEVNFQWKIIETASLAKEASDKIKINNLSFTHELVLDDRSNSPVDLIHSNSAIQYTEDPQEIIKLLKKIDFKYMYLTRIPLAIRGDSFEYMQSSRLSANGPGVMPASIKDASVEYKARVMKYEEFKRSLLSGCSLLFQLNEGPWDAARFGEEVGTFTFAIRKS